METNHSSSNKEDVESSSHQSPSKLKSEEEIKSCAAASSLSRVAPPPRGQLTRSEAVVVEEDNSNLLDFIKDTLNKSVKDRNIILRIETDLIQFIKDHGRPLLPFPSMSSYHRMLVHRISTIFNLDHNIDPIGNCVVVAKNNGKNGTLLNFRFKELLTEDDKKVTIIQRSSKDPGPCLPSSSNNIEKKKSYEERTSDYNKIRRRIFESEIWSGQKNHQQRLMKVESFELPSSQHHHKKLGTIKSYSFGGYNKLLTPQQKQDSSSSSSGISPASSGYKSQQSFNCDVTSPPPPMVNEQEHHALIRGGGGHCNNSSGGGSGGGHSNSGENIYSRYKVQENTQSSQDNVKVLWAITDLAQLPHNAILIDPQTGQQLVSTAPVPPPQGPQLHPHHHQLHPQMQLPPPPPQLQLGYYQQPAHPQLNISQPHPLQQLNPQLLQTQSGFQQQMTQDYTSPEVELATAWFNNINLQQNTNFYPDIYKHQQLLLIGQQQQVYHVMQQPQQLVVIPPQEYMAPQQQSYNFRPHPQQQQYWTHPQMGLHPQPHPQMGTGVLQLHQCPPPPPQQPPPARVPQLVWSRPHNPHSHAPQNISNHAPSTSQSMQQRNNIRYNKYK